MNAIQGQYFYVPFLVKNTELHIGKRPINSIYSGGATPWQDPKEKNKSTKLWYNWITRILQRVFKKLKKQFRN